MGCRLLTDAGSDDEVIAVIVEVEAYLGVADPASHARRGPTPRAAIMFEEAGHLYVYLSYGLHYCANIVTEATGIAGAVLLRAAAVQSEADTVRRRRLQAPRRGEARGWRRDGWQPTPPGGRSPARGSTPPHAVRAINDAALLRGPGNLCRGLGIQLGDNGLDICAPGARVRVLPRTTTPPLARGRRVGINAAVAEPLRFSWAGHPAVSQPVGLAPAGAPED